MQHSPTHASSDTPHHPCARPLLLSLQRTPAAGSRTPAYTLDELAQGKGLGGASAAASGGDAKPRQPTIATPKEPGSLGEGAVGVAAGDPRGGANVVAAADTAGRGLLEMASVSDGLLAGPAGRRVCRVQHGVARCRLHACKAEGALCTTVRCVPPLRLLAAARALMLTRHARSLCARNMQTRLRTPLASLAAA